MRAILRGGTLEPLDPVDLPDNTRLTVPLFDDADGDDLSAEALAKLAATAGALVFPHDDRENLHSDADGEAV